MTTGFAPLDDVGLARLDAWWRAANYLSVGQIYLLDNALLAEPLRPEHIKPRLLGHWGTTPGLNFIHAHLNRLIMERDRNILFVIGPLIEPGVSGAAWLGMPPGNENWRNRRSMPGASWLTPG